MPVWARVLLVGAGDTGRQVARELAATGKARLTVTNRSPQRAAELAAVFGCECLPFESLHARLWDYRAVICATDSPEPVIRRDTLGPPPGGSPADQRLVILDLAVPRDVEPALAELPGVHLTNVDDLDAIVGRNRSEREARADQAFVLVEEQTRRFLDWYRTRLAAAAIENLQLRFEEIRQEEIYRHRQRFSEDGIKQVEALTRSMVNKMLAVPILQLRELTVREKDPHGVLRFFRQIFGLDHDKEE